MRGAVAQPPVVAGDVADAVRNDLRGADRDRDCGREGRDAVVRVVVALQERRNVVGPEPAERLQGTVPLRTVGVLVGVQERLRDAVRLLRAEEPRRELPHPRVRVGQEREQVLVPADVAAREKRRQSADRRVLDPGRIEMAAAQKGSDRRLVRELRDQPDCPEPQALFLVFEPLQSERHDSRGRRRFDDRERLRPHRGGRGIQGLRDERQVGF